MPPGQRREFPPALANADTAIEQWRTEVLSKLPSRYEYATYLLAAAVEGYLGQAAQRTMPDRAAEYEFFARHYLQGLKFSLTGLSGDLRAEPFVAGVIHASFRAQDYQEALNIVEDMCQYALARDALLTYGWSGCELECREDGALRFVDPPEWPGNRDHAERAITQETKEEFANQLGAGPVISVEEKLLRAFDPNLTPGLLVQPDLPADLFLHTWIGLSSWLEPYWRNGQVAVVERHALAAHVQQEGGLSAVVAERFIQLLTFSREDSRLTLFHCPLVPLTTSSFVVIPTGFIMSNPTSVIPRLIVWRGEGLDQYSNTIANYLADRLQKQYEAHGVLIRTRLPYRDLRGESDIDLVIHEAASRRLLIAEVKAFIPPDSVEEVIRANDALAKGLSQVQRIRDWYGRNPWNEVARTLRLEGVTQRPDRIQFAVIGNGFVGSDYLAVPKDVIIADAQYLLLSRFKGCSATDAIDAFQHRFVVLPMNQATWVGCWARYWTGLR